MESTQTPDSGLRKAREERPGMFWNINAYHTMLLELEALYWGKYVVICHGQLQNAFDSSKEAIKFVYDSLNGTPSYIQQIGSNKVMMVPPGPILGTASERMIKSKGTASGKMIKEQVSGLPKQLDLALTLN